MAKLRITQVRSKNGETKLHQTVEVEDTPITRGMLEKVHHLVSYEVID